MAINHLLLKPQQRVQEVRGGAIVLNGFDWLSII